MKRRGKIFSVVLAGFILAGLVFSGWYIQKAVPIGTGYAAKYLCSSVFISKRNPESVFPDEVKPVNPLAKIIQFEVIPNQKAVTAHSFGLFKSKAIYREGCGCTLVVGTTEDELSRQKFFDPIPKVLKAESRPDLPWPVGNQGPVRHLPETIDAAKLKQALDKAFIEPDPTSPRKTRAVVVVYNGHLIAERYAVGFHENMPLLGWSMSKSVTNALVGILVRKGKLDLKRPAPVLEWSHKDDPRSRITLDQLLRMSSGLQFEEKYAPMYDATYMLYGSYDFAAYAANKPLTAEPDSTWYYSSGTANIIARIVRQVVEKEYPSYYNFIRQELFDRLGMSSAVMEPDPSGTFVGSSYMFATPRDWARFGLLYLQDGVWQGQRILPEGWVGYSTRPTPKAPQGQYGALFWLNAGSKDHPENRRWPRVPPDTFSAEGFQQQRVIVIPSKKLVVVRLGATSIRQAWNDDQFLSKLLEAISD